jgi:hypothetical protein
MNSHLNSKQLRALYDLYRWRDNIARETDESCEYVLKNHQLLKIAELLPREIYGILALCNPLSHVVQTNVHEMNEIIKSAREFTGVFTTVDINNAVNGLEPGATANNPTADQLGKASSNFLDTISQPVLSYDPESLLNCAHDFPHDDARTQDDESNANETQSMTDDAAHLNLKELLVKQSSQGNEKRFVLPSDLVFADVPSVQKRLFSTVASPARATTTTTSSIKNKKLLDKIEQIKRLVTNPFEMYLPADMRATSAVKLSPTDALTGISQWSLIKSVEPKPVVTKQAAAEAAAVAAAKQAADLNMIPLRKAFHSQTLSTKKKLKRLAS